MRQWPEAQRKDLVSAIADLPCPDDYRAAAQQLRRSYRLGTQRRKRLAKLLLKANARTLAAAENAELNALTEEFEQRTLELARALAGVSNSFRPAGKRSASR